MRALLLLCTCLMMWRAAAAQEPHIKREIALTYHYDDDDDDKVLIPDTVITEYDVRGQELHPRGITTYIDSSVVVQKNGNCTHSKQYWSDSSILDTYLYVCKDSQILITMSAADTLMIEKQILRHGRVLRSYRHTSVRWGLYDEEKIFCINTRNLKKGITTEVINNGRPDSFRFADNRLLRTKRTFAYNTYMHRWYQNRKTKNMRHKQVEWETFYHSYFKKSFTTRTTTLFDQYGHLKEEIKYDMQQKYMTSRTVYQYEYY